MYHVLWLVNESLFCALYFVLDNVVVVVDLHRCSICIKVTCVSMCKSHVLLVSAISGFVKEAEY
jgi:hypothetical protein